MLLCKSNTWLNVEVANNYYAQFLLIAQGTLIIIMKLAC